MAFEGLHEVVGFGFLAIWFLVIISSQLGNGRGVPEFPNLDEIIASSRDKLPLLTLSRCRADKATRRSGRRPADGVDTHAMRVEELVRPAVIAELEHADIAVRRGAGEQTAALVRRPRHHIDGRGVQGKVKDLAPRAARDGRRAGGLLPPDQDFAIVGRGCEDRAEFRVCL